MPAPIPVQLEAPLASFQADRPIEQRRVGRGYRVRGRMARLALIPAVVIMAFCFYGSIFWTVYISMTRSFLLPVYKFAGTAQYARLFATPRWQVAYSNMFIFGFLDIIGTLGLGILLAILLDRSVRYEGIFRTILLYPLSISFIVTGLTWQWILSPTIGVQQLVRSLGWTTSASTGSPNRRLRSTRWCLPASGTNPA